MVSINYAFREICCKIVYYGPGLSGKTTNLIYIHKKAPPQTKGELISLATDADRTLYFDFLPLDIGKVQGFSTKFQLYTVPGQVYYNATRKLVLRGVDGLVFVADSQVAKLEENIESMHNLVENLQEYGYVLEELPMVMQYNKRDLEEVSSIEELERVLNPRGLTYFEAVAVKGEGVFDTLKGVSKLVLEKAMGKPETERKEELVAVPSQPKIFVPAEGEKVEQKPVGKIVTEKEAFEERVKQKIEEPVLVDKMEEIERVEIKEKEEEIEKIEKVEEAVLLDHEDEVKKFEEEDRVKKVEILEEILEKEKKEKRLERVEIKGTEVEEVEEVKKKEERNTLIQSQTEIEEEVSKAKKVFEEKIIEEQAGSLSTEETKPLFQQRVVASPMLRQKKTKSAWGGFLWKWIRKITGRR